MRPKLVIWGAGGHGLVVADIVRLQREYDLVGFLDDRVADQRPAELCGAPILGDREQLPGLRAAGVDRVIVAVGAGSARLALADLVRRAGLTLGTAVHPRAVIAVGVPIGRGTVVAAGAVVNPGARVDDNVIINTCASLDHHCVVEAGAHVCPGAHLAGGVRVGCEAWVGIGAAVGPGVRIGARAIIGAGAVVLKDIPEGVVAYGVPARAIRLVGP